MAVRIHRSAAGRHSAIVRWTQNRYRSWKCILMGTIAVATLGVALKNLLSVGSLALAETEIILDVELPLQRNEQQQPPLSSKASIQEKDNQQQKKPFIFRQIRPTIHVLGERHSGTKWITQHLVDCFNHTAQIRRGLTRWKHWFQEDGDYGENQIGQQAIVVAQFRHVLQWVKAMQTDSYHAPAHFNMSWHDYVTTPWTMPARGRDLHLNDTTMRAASNICQYHFRPQQVIPCLENTSIRVHNDRDVYPCYELRNDGSGMPYDSILELRADKIRNFLSIRHFQYIQALIVVRYEEMVLSGTESLVRNIETQLNTKARCAPLPPQAQLSRRRLPRKFVEWMRDLVDWDAEKLIGYEFDDHKRW